MRGLDFAIVFTVVDNLLTETLQGLNFTVLDVVKAAEDLPAFVSEPQIAKPSTFSGKKLGFVVLVSL